MNFSTVRTVETSLFGKTKLFLLFQSIYIFSQRLKQTLQQRLAKLDGYEQAETTEREIAFTEEKLTGAEREAAYLAAERASLESKTELKRRAISALQEDVTTLEGQLAVAQGEETEAIEVRDQRAAEVKKLGERLAESRASFKGKYASFVLSKRRREERARIEHLVAAYKGRVYGRFGALLKPVNRTYVLYNCVLFISNSSLSQLF